MRFSPFLLVFALNEDDYREKHISHSLYTCSHKWRNCVSANTLIDWNRFQKDNEDINNNFFCFFLKKWYLKRKKLWTLFKLYTQINIKKYKLSMKCMWNVCRTWSDKKVTRIYNFFRLLYVLRLLIIK